MYPEDIGEIVRLDLQEPDFQVPVQDKIQGHIPQMMPVLFHDLQSQNTELGYLLPLGLGSLGAEAKNSLQAFHPWTQLIAVAKIGNDAVLDGDLHFKPLVLPFLGGILLQVNAEIHFMPLAIKENLLLDKIVPPRSLLEQVFEYVGICG